MSERDDLVLDAVAGRRATSTGWVRGNCPMCELQTGQADKRQCLGLNVETGEWHCFAGDTRVLTRRGYVEIRDLAGRTAEILTVAENGAARWSVAPFSVFGRQHLLSVRVSRNGVEKVIRATEGHRWFVRGRPWREVLTVDLRPGYRLRSVAPPRSGTILASPWGVAHGFAFGDGERLSGSAGVRVNLWGAKDAALLPFYPLSPRGPVDRGDLRGVRVDGLPRFFKKLPSLAEHPAYLYGWLAGYFAADGCVDDTGLCKLSSASLASLEFVRRLCLRVGVFCYEPTHQMRVGYGSEPTPLYSLVLSRSSLSDDFFVVKEHRRRWLVGRDAQERRGWAVVSVVDEGHVDCVYCAEVPGSASFALEGHILVGNCFRCGSAGVLQDVPENIETIERAKPREAQGKIELPEGFLPLFEEPGLSFPFTDAARVYLERRGLPVEVGRAAKIGVVLTGHYRGRVVVPVFDSLGRVLVGWSARLYIESPFPKYLYPAGMNRREIVYNGAALPRDTTDPIFVVEGVFDALALWPDAVACLGKPSAPQVDMLVASRRPIVALLDGDAWRESLALMLRLRLRGRTAGSVRLPPRLDPATVDAAAVRRAGAVALSTGAQVIYTEAA